MVTLPSNSTIKYRPWNSTKAITIDWQEKKVDCTDLAPAYCNMNVVLPDGAYVEISGVGWFQNGAVVTLPSNGTISYRPWNSTKAVTTDWKTKTVDCTDLAPSYCDMGIVLNDPSDGWVEVSGVGWFQNGGQVWLPVGATVRYRVWNASKTQVVADWKDKSVDCNDLVYP